MTIKQHNVGIELSHEKLMTVLINRFYFNLKWYGVNTDLFAVHSIILNEDKKGTIVFKHKDDGEFENRRIMFKDFKYNKKGYILTFNPPIFF
jgi:hypothetical protein